MDPTSNSSSSSAPASTPPGSAAPPTNPTPPPQRSNSQLIIKAAVPRPPTVRKRGAAPRNQSRPAAATTTTVPTPAPGASTSTLPIGNSSYGFTTTYLYPSQSNAGTRGAFQFQQYQPYYAAAASSTTNLADPSAVPQQGQPSTAPSQPASSLGSVYKPVKTRTPSPPPPLAHWDECIVAFFKRAGLHQTLKGFEADMIAMNDDWERIEIPKALDSLIQTFQTLRTRDIQMRDATINSDSSFETRKVNYVHRADGKPAATPSTINRDISSFLARTRARNDASNTAEFLQSLAEKRAAHAGTTAPDDESTCARVDAKRQDRDVQIKYDIAKNEDGPLRKTMKSWDTEAAPSQGKKGKAKGKKGKTDSHQDAQVPSAHTPDTTGTTERLTNIEKHLAVQFVPSAPRDFPIRLKYLEDHLIRLEKDFPPWAALHFNQPHRGWPPPPRTSPIIVPVHLLGDNPQSSANAASLAGAALPPNIKNTGSSLQKAMLERLEVQRAMQDVAKRG